MNNNYGKLIQPPIKLQRKNFEEMCTLIGVRVEYQYPLENKDYSTQGELISDFSKKEKVWCIVNEHLDQKTAKLLGWNAELQEEMTAISLPYNLHDLQVGCLIEIPSAFDDAPGRMFKIEEMSTIMLYPASVTCRLAPWYETAMAPADTELFANTNFNLLYEGDDY